MKDNNHANGQANNNPSNSNTHDSSTTISNNNSEGLEFTQEQESRHFLKGKLSEKQTALAQISPQAKPLERAKLQLEIAEIMLELAEGGMPEAAWGLAKEAFYLFMKNDQIESAVNALDCLYRCDLPSSIVALGHAMWLSVTYPIDPELSLLIMKNLIDDTPDKSDGAAVAAVTAHYIADLRLAGDQRDSVMFLTTNLIANVAERHSNITDQGQLNFWMEKLELNDPQLFLPKLAKVIDALVDDNWWFDKDDLRANLPVN